MNFVSLNERQILKWSISMAAKNLAENNIWKQGLL